AVARLSSRWNRSRASSRRLRVCLSITELTRQIPNRALVGSPPVFVALDLRPFRIGELGERLGCLLERVHHGDGSRSSETGGDGDWRVSRHWSTAAMLVDGGEAIRGPEASPSTKPVSMQLWARARPHSSKVAGRPA